MAHSKVMQELLHKVERLENHIVELKTDNVWIKRIIIGAVSLGYGMKLVAFLLKGQH